MEQTQHEQQPAARLEGQPTQSEPGQAGQPQGGEGAAEASLRVAFVETGMSLKHTVEWLVQTVRAVLETVRWLLQTVVDLLRAILLALREAVSSAVHVWEAGSSLARALGQGLAAVVMKLWQVVARIVGGHQEEAGPAEQPAQPEQAAA